MMQKRTSLMAVVFALAVLLVSTSGVFAQVQLAHFDVLSPPETCVICHSGAGEKKHQAIYDDYADESTLELTIDGVKSVDNGDGTFNATMMLTIKKNGAAYIDADGLPSLEQKRFYAVTYDSATRQFLNSQSFSNPAALGDGKYSVTATGIAYDLNNSNGLAYGYIADGLLDTESGGHVSMYDDVSNAGLAFGDAATYESAANVSGCEKCHGAPYMKHGYRGPQVEGLSDFSTCKTCHYDDRNGGHEDWQILVDNPARYAEIHAGDSLTADEEAQYAYTANIKNDVHMSHAMEFPYPQSMSTCATCHEGKLDMILTDANFKLETCVSCHPVTGPEEGTDPHRAPALADVMSHDISLGECSNCHTDGSVAPVFSEIHTGYDEHVYAGDGTKYSDAITVTIDDPTLDGTMLTINFHATGTVGTADAADIVPAVYVGGYGFDTKDFLSPAYGGLEGQSGVWDFNPDDAYLRGSAYFSGETTNGATWSVTFDLTGLDYYEDGAIKRIEIGVAPALTVGSNNVVLQSVSRTFNLEDGAYEDYYAPIVDFDTKCSNCHDELMPHVSHGMYFASNVTMCKMCHTPMSGSVHLEMQSRSFDSYVHAIHSFQAFDIGDVNFADPVEALRYDLHVEHVYPNFTIKNCESCHNEGTFEVPDQSRSLPGLLSGSDSVETWDRNIGVVPAYITGPGSRACGACHRADLIAEDEAGELVSLNQHTKQGGYLIEEGADSDETQGLLMTVIDYIMALFK
ncbi:MAG: hypothetical protein RQ760_13855 [Sedimentisphaerales bacterium]|nr:hypothetical protein [Sedimentisphaerales bacterium]